MLMTLEEAAAELQVTRYWLNKWLRKNPDCYIPAGRKKRFEVADIERIKERLRETNRVSRSLRQARSRRSSASATSSETTWIKVAQLFGDSSFLDRAPQTAHVRELKAHMEANPSPRGARKNKR
jgi:hypothetical protein